MGDHGPFLSPCNDSFGGNMFNKCNELNAAYDNKVPNNKKIKIKISN
jgi:hypothetical protein